MVTVRRVAVPVFYSIRRLVRMVVLPVATLAVGITVLQVVLRYMPVLCKKHLEVPIVPYIA